MKIEICEWSDCDKHITVYVNIDGEAYGFCSDEHADEFWESIREHY